MDAVQTVGRARTRFPYFAAQRRGPHAGVGPTSCTYKKQLFLGPYYARDEQKRITYAQERQSTDLNEYYPAVGLNVL